MSSLASRDSSSLLTIVKAQIVFLLSTLTEDRYERNQANIRSLSEQHGLETYLHFIRRLIANSQTRLQATTPPSAFDAGSALTFRLLVQETQRLARDPFLADRFREAIDKGEGDVFRHFDLVRFADRVGLRPLERLVLASSIVATTMTRRELASQAAQLIRAHFDEAVLAITRNPAFDHEDLSPSQLALLLSHLLSDPPPDLPILDAHQRVALIVAAQSKYGLEIMGPILQKIFPTLSLSPGTSLVQTLCQLGPDITNDPETVRALLKRFGISESSPPRETQVVEILSTLARLAAEGTALCDVGSLVKAIISLPATIDWCNVLLQSFDRPERSGIDTATLKLLIAILPNTPRDAEHPSIEAFWKDWNNTLYQLRLLDALLSLPNDTFNLVSLPGRRIVTVDDVAAASPTIKALAANVQGHTWNSLDLIETLVRLGDVENAEVKQTVHEMLDKAVKISAELVHMGLLQVSKPWGATQQEYAERLLGMFLAGHPNHQLVFMRIWQIDPTYLTDAFRNFYQDSALNITRILDVAQDLKILDSLLEVRPFGFALDVAALASRREYLNLDKWLSDHVTAHGPDFTRAVLEFLDVKINSELARQDPQVEQRTMPLNPQTIAIFIRMLRPIVKDMPDADQKYFTEIRNLSYQLYPRLLNLVPGSDAESGLTVASFATDIETEIENIYKQMYKGAISIDRVVEMLREWKASSNTREKEVFACTLHSLFDEYKFFQSTYPARELAMTAYLFGSIIQNHLIDYIPLGIAIRYVLDAIRSHPDSNLFTFGIEALMRFESRLPEWPALCNTLLRIPHLHPTRPDVADILRRALSRADTVNRVDARDEIQLPSLDPPALSFTSIQADDLSTEPLEEPAPEDSEKILFIINNLAINNFQSKLDEMRERFRADYSRWFANYLIDQRISTEPNNHHIYLRFLDGLDSHVLNRHIVQETLFKSSVLLNAEKTLQSSSERTILKNLGSWLGSITLARDHAIKFRNLSFKNLLLEGYDSNRLIVAIPFVCKVLEQCTKSTVFVPPNPWLMAVLALLLELYHFAELKLNLKFEIEMLCKALKVDLDKLEASSLLRNRPSSLDSLAGPSLPDFVSDMESLPIGNYDGSALHGLEQSGQVLQLGGTSGADSQVIDAHIEAIISEIPNLITVNSQLAALAVNPGFKNGIQVAIERAVREIIIPVVQRSVTIAGISTQQLVAKDFALEPDEVKMRKAAHLMVQYLAGNLALVTCKEPLRSNMVTHVRAQLLELGYTEQLVPEQAIMLIVQDNVDVACQAIEKAAKERAVMEVDAAFAPAYHDRRLHREQRPGQRFQDRTLAVADFADVLPESLRPSALHPEQFRIYEDFELDARRYLGSLYDTNGARPGSAGLSYNGIATTPEMGSKGPLSHQEAFDRFSQLVGELERMLEQMPANMTANTLPANHDITHCVRQILVLATQPTEREESALSFSQKVVQYLYKTQTQLGREVYALLLQRLCESSPHVNKEAIDWLVYAEDERKFNAPVTAVLLRNNIIPVAQQDAQLAKIIVRDARPSAINFTANLIRDCLLDAQPYATRQQFRHSLEALAQVVEMGKGTDAAVRLLEELQHSSDGSDGVDTAVYDRLAHHFADWVRLFSRSASTEKSFVAWVTQLQEQGILRGEEISSFFYRVCIESAVTLWTELLRTGDEQMAYQPVDALSRMIVYIIKYNSDVVSAKTVYFTKILSIVCVVLAHYHEERGTDFPQKPFFRLFSTLFNDLHMADTSLQSAQPQLMSALCDTFNTLQPTYFPGFAFSWISLISHRLFMPKLLGTEDRAGWPAFHRLLLSLLKFLGPFIRAGDVQNTSRLLFRGGERLLLVLLHDFPEFLSEHYFSICDAIPARCIQLRNIVQSAFPSSVALPDPHVINIRAEGFEMGPIPPIQSDFTSLLGDGEVRGVVDRYLASGTGSDLGFIPSVVSMLSTPPTTPQAGPEKYHLSRMNAFVLYVGAGAVVAAKTRAGSTAFSATDPGALLLMALATELDVEGQHHLMSAITMHLRYPNAHTQWFSSLVLHLFANVESTSGVFQEIVTKVLLERVLVHRPHPWGVIVTFVELLRNPEFDFWGKGFVRMTREIALLLENVSRFISL